MLFRSLVLDLLSVFSASPGSGRQHPCLISYISVVLSALVRVLAPGALARLAPFGASEAVEDGLCEVSLLALRPRGLHGPGPLREAFLLYYTHSPCPSSGTDCMLCTP